MTGKKSIFFPVHFPLNDKFLFVDGNYLAHDYTISHTNTPISHTITPISYTNYPISHTISKSVGMGFLLKMIKNGRMSMNE